MSTTRVVQWAYGVTTCDKRIESYLQDTLVSLQQAGFPKPRLFIDGNFRSSASSFPLFPNMEMSLRCPKIGAYGSWFLALTELYIRNPYADRYAIFQDDILICSRLREYLDTIPYPPKGYWNLFTFPYNSIAGVQSDNESFVRGKVCGFHPSNQRGHGALALVFDRLAVQTILMSKHNIQKPTSINYPKTKIDGAVAQSLCIDNGWTEYVHNPSLCQHVGMISAIGNEPHPQSTIFPGTEFDCTTLIKDNKR